MNRSARETYCDCGEMLANAYDRGHYLILENEYLGKCPGCGKPYLISEVSY